MADDTLESLAARIAKLERETLRRKDLIPPSRPLASVIGMFEGSEFMKQVDVEVTAIRDAEQKALDERPDARFC